MFAAVFLGALTALIGLLVIASYTDVLPEKRIA